MRNLTSVVYTEVMTEMSKAQTRIFNMVADAGREVELSEIRTGSPRANAPRTLQSLVTAGRLTVRGERTEAGFKIWYSVPAPKPSTSIKLTYFPEANQIEWA